MTRVSVESCSKYLPWFFDLDEFRKLLICNGLENESKERKNSAYYQKKLPHSSLRNKGISIFESSSHSYIHDQYRRRNYQHQEHLEKIDLEKASNDKIPSIPPLFSPLGISRIFFCLSEFTKTNMRSETYAPENYKSCYDTLIKPSLRLEK